MTELFFGVLGFAAGLVFIPAIARDWDWRWPEVVVVCVAVVILLAVFFSTWGRS